MKVVALVSGGKDSCYGMMRCIDFGHQIVALANLLPENDTIDELDSYMYQTVGHQIVDAYAQCMGLPLFRKRIQGQLKNSDLRYNRTEGDEVEDLELLLRAVKKQVPEVEAVSTGAIASDYQRLRVENVCSRLGLVSLAYLWKQNQDELLQEMVERGIVAVLVKVAAMGLDPHKHLGKDLQSMRPTFSRLHEQYGCNICGEGGEYESLTLDCPLFRNARIVLDEFQIVLHSPGSIAPVGVLHPTKFHLEPKVDGDMTVSPSVFWVNSPEDDRVSSQEKRNTVKQKIGHECCYAITKPEGPYITVSCWEKKDSVRAGGFAALLGKAQSILEEERLGWSNVLYVHVYVQNMEEFGQINSIYSQHITEGDCSNGVPSRATVAVPLDECDLGAALVEVLAATTSESKRVLHVQSISCWAPSCIGPYSQATLHGGLLFMAGQIGLDAATMTLVPGGPPAEILQVLRNCEAVATSFGPGLRSDSISLTVYCSSWLKDSDRREVDNCVKAFFETSAAQPLLVFVFVSGLPKGASVEIEPLLLENTQLVGGNLSRSAGSCSCRYHFFPGRICKAVSVLDIQLSSEAMSQLLESSIEQLSEALQESNLSWTNVVAFRAYFVPSEVSYESLKTVLQLKIPQPLLIPVHGLGLNCELKYAVAFDLLALTG